jgi:hypothetical protein
MLLIVDKKEKSYLVGIKHELTGMSDISFVHE